MGNDPSSMTGGSRSAYGPRRAADLMVALGKERAAEVLTHLTEDQVARLTWLVGHTVQLDSDQREDVLRDFYASLMSRDYASVGGPETAQRMLEAAFGEERATDLQAHLGSLGKPKPFKFLERVSITVLVQFLTTEHPQMVALILVNLGTDYASEVLGSLPDELQVETLIRVAGLNTPSPEAVTLVDEIMQQRLAGSINGAAEPPPLAGSERLIEVLRYIDISSQRVILDGIAELDPALGAKIRQQMFVFDDLASLDDRSLQRVLREVDQADLTLALRAAGEDVREVVFANMSSRASAMVRDDMEVGGPVRMTVIHEAQNRIVTIVRRLQDSEEIVVNTGAGDELVA